MADLLIEYLRSRGQLHESRVTALTGGPNAGIDAGVANSVLVKVKQNDLISNGRPGEERPQ